MAFTLACAKVNFVNSDELCLTLRMKLFCESNENRNRILKVIQRIEWPLQSDIDIARGDHTEWADGTPDT